MTQFRCYNKTCNFLYTRLSGALTSNDLLQHVQDINQEYTGIPNLLELSDCRGLTSVEMLSTSDTIAIARSETDKPGSKLAIVTPKDQDSIFGLARAYQMSSEAHRESVNVFRDLDEALNWLTDNDTSKKSALISYINTLE